VRGQRAESKAGITNLEFRITSLDSDEWREALNLEQFKP